MRTMASGHGHSLPLLFLLLLSVLLFAGYRSCSGLRTGNGEPGGTAHLSPQTPKTGGGAGAGIATLALAKAPRHVRQLVAHLKSAKGLLPPKGYKGGRLFRNREGLLPKGKTYYEFDVHPFRPGISRGGERLVVDQKKNVFYYTKDHYGSFVKIK